MKTELTLMDGSTYCALPCPFCGGTSLTTDTWCFDDGEVDAITCRRCESAALHTAWNQRKGCDYTAPPLDEVQQPEGGER